MPAGAGEDHRLATVIFPETPVSRQAESDRFRRRDCLACDPAITGQPLSGGSLTREESHVRRTVAARRGGVAACRACAGGASALAPPALHTAARLPAALRAVTKRSLPPPP